MVKGETSMPTQANVEAYLNRKARRLHGRGTCVAKRHVTIVYLAAKGYTREEVACELDITDNTLKTHTRELLRLTGEESVGFNSLMCGLK